MKNELLKFEKCTARTRPEKFATTNGSERVHFLRDKWEWMDAWLFHILPLLAQKQLSKKRRFLKSRETGEKEDDGEGGEIQNNDI